MARWLPGDTPFMAEKMAEGSYDGSTATPAGRVLLFFVNVRARPYPV
jgi:hypothetical protein